MRKLLLFLLLFTTAIPFAQIDSTKIVIDNSLSEEKNQEEEKGFPFVIIEKKTCFSGL